MASDISVAARALIVMLVLVAPKSGFRTEAAANEVPQVAERSPWEAIPQAPRASSAGATVSLRLDGVEISIQALSFPSGQFTSPEADASDQVATSVSWRPFRELSVTVVPFGHRPGTESLPAAAAGQARLYEADLRNYRRQQGGSVQNGPAAMLFGKPVTAIHSIVELYIDGPVQKPVVIDEWVTEADDRLWVVRASQQEETDRTASQSADFATGLVLERAVGAGSATVSPAVTPNLASGGFAASSGTDLPAPAWWNGDCDYNTYFAGSGGTGSSRLGTVYRGMPACGPRPWADHAPDVMVRFFSGAWGEMEWECVELTMRFLYLMYGIAPYQANGSQVVWNYTGNQLAKVPNGTIGQAPQPDDVLSYGATSTFGHASVVTASSVDASGNGTITVIEQNNSANGSSVLSVSNWVVSGNAGTVSGWLHNNSNGGAYVSVAIGATAMGTYFVPAGGSIRKNYAGMDSGPMTVTSNTGAPIVAAIRDLWSDSTHPTSSIQVMGLPASLLSTSYYFPAYNDVSLDDQIRFGNVGTAPTYVTVTIGGLVHGIYYLLPSQSQRVSYPGVDSGPVVIESTGNVPVIASIRDSWWDGAEWTSYAQLMGLPASLLSTAYYFPAYNNVSLDDQIRIGNVGTSPTWVTVTIGGVVRGTYWLAPSQSQRVSYAALDSGPVVVSSSGGVPIIASIRDSWNNGTTWTSYSQLMGLPAGQLSDTYHFPAYDNVSLDGQLRFGNVGAAPTWVTVTIGGVVQGMYWLAPSASLRVSYAGLDGGPVKIQSTGGVPIIASLRDSWWDGTAWTSYAQLMGLPASQLSTSYYFPAYNNVSLDDQLRIGVP